MRGAEAEPVTGKSILRLRSALSNGANTPETRKEALGIIIRGGKEIGPRTLSKLLTLVAAGWAHDGEVPDNELETKNLPPLLK